MNFHVNLRIYYYTALSASTKKLGAKIQTHPIVSVSRESLSMKKNLIPIKIKDFFDISRKKVKKKLLSTFFWGEEEE